MPEGTTVAPWPSGRAAFLHGAHSAVSATPASVKLIWPVPAGHNLVTFYDPDWTGGGDDTYPGHHGLDIGFHCGSQGCDWNDMVNNPTDIYACAGGTDIWTEDSYDDQCAAVDPPGSAHAPGGNLCQDICGYSCQMPTGPTGDNQQDCEAAGGTWTGSPCVNSVVIDHGPNTGLPYRYTGYYHIAKNSIPTALKTANAPVAKGDRIAYIGSSGSSSGPHIHFEVSPDIVSGGGVDAALDHSASVDPFLSIWGGSNTTESLWEDQCSLPIYNTNTPSGNIPPLLTNCLARLLNKEIPTGCHPCNDCGGATPPPEGTTPPPGEPPLCWPEPCPTYVLYYCTVANMSWGCAASTCTDYYGVGCDPSLPGVTMYNTWEECDAVCSTFGKWHLYKEWTPDA